jgi:lantibiotic leader peptide-processing serine protease
MNRPPAHLLALLAASTLAGCADASAPDTPLAPAAGISVSAAAVGETSGSYLVSFNSGVPAGFGDRVAALGGTVVFAHGGAGFGAVAGLSAEAAAQLAALPGLRAVTPDEATLLDDARLTPEEPGAAGDLASPLNPAGAFYYGRQWNLRAVGADQAWAAGRRGSPGVRVAILDTGLDYRHPDLQGRVDFAASRSFLPSQDTMVAGLFPGAHPMADLHGHGTLVGSVVSSNAWYVAGMTSQTRLVGVKVCTYQGRCPVSAVLAGLVYAADQGVDVANLSLGNRFARRDSSAASQPGPALVAVVNTAFNYAHRKGVTVVVAGGNDARDLDHDGNDYRLYCSAPTVICVSATGPTGGALTGPFIDPDAPAWYTVYGRSAIDVAAPGGAFIPVTGPCSSFSVQFTHCRTLPTVITGAGTSMAAPHVSGAAALVVEDVGRSPAQVRVRLEQTADDLGQPGTDPYYGKGRINVARALGLP